MSSSPSNPKCRIPDHPSGCKCHFVCSLCFRLHTARPEGYVETKKRQMDDGESTIPKKPKK